MVDVFYDAQRCERARGRYVERGCVVGEGPLLDPAGGWGDVALAEHGPRVSSTFAPMYATRNSNSAIGGMNTLVPMLNLF